MEYTLHKKAQSIYSKFTKAPILEMVQYLVDNNVDAQVLKELKIIDSKHHKNAYVKSYAERIYDSYERICKVLVTYPSLEFSNQQFSIKKNKESKFIKEFFLMDAKVSEELLDAMLKLVNISLTNAIESNDFVQEQLMIIGQYPIWIDRFHMFVKQASGEDYFHFFQNLMNR